MFLKTSILLPHLFCNVKFELTQMISQHQTFVKILIFKTEMLLESEIRTNIEINAFWIRLKFVRYRFVRYIFVLEDKTLLHGRCAEDQQMLHCEMTF